MHVMLAQATPSNTSFLGWMVTELTTVSSLLILVDTRLDADLVSALPRPVCSHGRITGR